MVDNQKPVRADSISRSDPVTVTKKVVKSGRGLALSIPRDVIDLLTLDSGSVLEVTIVRLEPSPSKVEPISEGL